MLLQYSKNVKYGGDPEMKKAMKLICSILMCFNMISVSAEEPADMETAEGEISTEPVSDSEIPAEENNEEEEIPEIITAETEEEDTEPVEIAEQEETVPEETAEEEITVSEETEEQPKATEEEQTETEPEEESEENVSEEVSEETAVEEPAEETEVPSGIPAWEIELAEGLIGEEMAEESAVSYLEGTASYREADLAYDLTIVSNYNNKQYKPSVKTWYC